MTSQPEARTLGPDLTLIREPGGDLYLASPGALILDFLRPADWEPVVGGFAALLRAGSQQNRLEDPASVDRVEPLLAKRSLGARLYGIRRGLRIVVTSRLVELPESRELAAEFGAHPPHEDFRVLLTPDTAKLGPAPIEEQPLEEWLFLCPYSAAQYIRTIGPREVPQQLREIVEAHDRYTQALTRKPLLLAGL